MEISQDGLRGRGGDGPRHPVRVRRLPGRLGGHEQERQQVLQDSQQGQFDFQECQALSIPYGEN